MNSSEGKNDVSLSHEFQEEINLLRETYFFSSLPLDVLKLLAYLCTRETFKAGDYLFNQGEDDGQAFLIMSGETRLSHSTDDEERAVRDFSQQTFVGGLALMGRLQRLFSLQAVSDTTCLVLSRDKFEKAMEQFPDQVPKIIKAIVERISNWEERFLGEINEDCEACRSKIGVSLI